MFIQPEKHKLKNIRIIKSIAIQVLTSIVMAILIIGALICLLAQAVGGANERQSQHINNFNK